MKNGWRWFWRTLAVLAVFGTLCCAFLLFELWRNVGVRTTAAGRPIGLDVIAVQLDILSLTIAVVGIGLGEISIFGYQNIKDGSLARAEKVGAEEARRVAQEYAARQGDVALNTNGTHMTVQEKGEADETGSDQVPRPPVFDPADVSIAGAVKETGNGDDERDGGDEGGPAASGRSPTGSDGSARE